jgi:hypothetical protein
MAYEAPRIDTVGSVKDITLGHLFSDGQDSLSSIPVIGGLFGS